MKLLIVEKRRNRGWERVCRSKIPRQAANENLWRGMGTGFAARLPGSQPATVALGFSPPSSSGLLSYFFSSRHSSLTRFHSCVSEKRTFPVYVCVCAYMQDFLVLHDCTWLCERLTRGCVGEENKRGGGSSGCQVGWDGKSCSHNVQIAINSLSQNIT